MKKISSFILIVLLALVAIWGCAPTRTYTLYISYIPQEKGPTGTAVLAKGIIGLGDFKDLRKEKDLLGVRQRGGGRTDRFIPWERDLSASVREIIRDYFLQRGFKVVRLEGYSPERDPLEAMPQGLDLAISGLIEELKVDSRSGLIKDVTRIRIGLKAYIAHPRRREVITRTIKSSPERTTLIFDVKRVEKDLSRTLSQAVEELFSGLP